MPPAAAVTSTTSSGPISATSRIAIVVRPVPIMATAAASLTWSGSRCSDVAATTASSA